MNTPTEAHRGLVEIVFDLLSTTDMIGPSPADKAAQLIADSEARAIATQLEVVVILTRRWLNVEKERDQLRAEVERLRVLRSALENLCDEQNGAPLETRRDQWQLAMDGAGLALAATEESK